MEEKVIILGALIEARGVISEYVDLDVNAKTSYKLMKILDATEKDNQFYFDKLKSIIEKYGERNENGELSFDERGNVKIQSDLIAEARNQINETASVEISIPCKYLLSIEDLDDFKMSCRKIKMLEAFLKDE